MCHQKRARLKFCVNDKLRQTKKHLPQWVLPETVKTQLGEVEIKVSRERNGSFEPKIIGKYSRNADGS